MFEIAVDMAMTSLVLLFLGELERVQEDAVVISSKSSGDRWLRGRTTERVGFPHKAELGFADGGRREKLF